MKNKKNDEKKEIIIKHPNSITLKIVIAILSAWVVYEIVISLIDSTPLNILPASLIVIIIGVRTLFIQHINKKITLENPEYTIPASTIKLILIAIIIIMGIILSLGKLFLR